ncbi:heterokaryon incompatibility protein-domain-containing protein [Paraphoma chrysanthemicola]|uniref:Heterokaryon incompatibility protein-domain-containing protein n=1 Tax=Paraphoma chrysanthemicola TaxID=798071 RepID=A0A8K0W2E2_9PLEO|nr:heterokaryon incompatibility protein-domain-containing protein [Paraphoma chrysanthemicola]
MESYHYTNLNPTLDEIRLFTLKPSASGSKIEGILKNYPLQNVPSYHALSYVWGNPEDTRAILVDGHTLSVTANLYDALQHIRDIHHSTTLWIDAVCINQSDSTERGLQVQMMKTIFANADGVIAWIGPSSAHCGIAMEFILQFAHPNVNMERLLERADSEGSRLQNSIHDLFMRPYWGRVWIVQELASARTAQVRCGHYSAPLEAFQVFITALNSRLGTIANYMSVTKACRLLKLVKIYWQQSMDKQRLIDILWSTVDFQATDQRDKIYAILGIAREQDQKALPLDYTAETTSSSLLRNLVRHHLENEGDFDILCYFPPLQTQFTDCSWLPDLGQYINGLCPASFRASADTRPAFRFSSDMNYLTTKGIALTIVDTVVGPFEFARFLDSSLENHQSTIFKDNAFTSLKYAALQALHTRILPGATEDFVEDYFWNNIVGDNIMLGADGPEVPCPCGYLELWESVLPRAYNGTLSKPFRAQERPRSHITNNGIAESVDDMAKHFERAVNLASMMRLSGRCVFVTADGMAGLGPTNLEKGDTVSIIFGCRLPLVLREVGQQFRLIGPAYVHGAMRGEYVDGIEADLVQVQEFTLR